jgi:hypothetical protein
VRKSSALQVLVIVLLIFVVALAMFVGASLVGPLR